VDVVLHLLEHALQITGFVAVMMLVIEYLNVVTSGSWQERLAGRRWGQYLLAAALGATPGCLGAFAVVAMYSHRVVTVGAVVAAMIVTSGDESFVMLAVVPKQALAMTAVLTVIGIGAGALTDLVVQSRDPRPEPECEGLALHEQEHCDCFPRGKILRQWRECTAARGILTFVLVIFVAAVASGRIGSEEETWIRVTLIAASAVALFIVATVPDHFLDDHLWKHVALKHVPRVFMWTLGALVLMHVLVERLHVEEAISRGEWARWILLGVACLVGLIPESGPHLIFVTLYARGTVPLSVLVASSIVQDGHGMLPLLAHSRRAFFGVKLVNLLVGLAAGAVVMAAGY
jgi:hypothetical protein